MKKFILRNKLSPKPIEKQMTIYGKPEGKIIPAYPIRASLIEKKLNAKMIE